MENVDCGVLYRLERGVYARLRSNSATTSAARRSQNHAGHFEMAQIHAVFHTMLFSTFKYFIHEDVYASIEF